MSLFLVRRGQVSWLIAADSRRDAKTKLVAEYAGLTQPITIRPSELYARRALPDEIAGFEAQEAALLERMFYRKQMHHGRGPGLRDGPRSART